MAPFQQKRLAMLATDEPDPQENCLHDITELSSWGWAWLTEENPALTSSSSSSSDSSSSPLPSSQLSISRTLSWGSPWKSPDLPYGGNLKKATQKGDRDAIREIMMDRQRKMSAARPYQPPRPGIQPSIVSAAATSASSGDGNGATAAEPITGPVGDTAVIAEATEYYK